MLLKLNNQEIYIASVSTSRYFGAGTVDASLRTLFPSAHSYCYELQSNNALRNTSTAPSLEISMGDAG